MEKEQLSVALLQQDLIWENPEANRDKFDSLIRGLEGNPDIIVMPEMFSTGFSMNPAQHASDMNQPMLDAMKEWSRLKNAAICGSLMMKHDNTFVNRFVWVEPNADVQFYDKAHLFRMGEENQHYTAGNKRLLIRFRGWNIAPFVCYDLRFPVWLRRTPEFDYDMLLFVANWPERRTYHWRTLALARAIENQSYVVAVNRVGVDGYGVSYQGDSQVVDPLGMPIFRADDFKEVAETVTISKNNLLEYRKNFPAWADADPFFIPSLQPY